MIEQLNKQGLSPEQLQKLIKEVAEAAKPGSQYGQVGERLKQAAQKAGAGDKPGAAQNLAQAQQELQKLLDALADAQSLQSTLDALARAQSALGQCKSWGECQSPGSGRGGKPGRGVGTWADDLGWNFFPGQWLAQMDGVSASMTMGQPFPDVWLPHGLEMNIRMLVAVGSIDLKYTLQYENYRQPDVRSKITIPENP